MDNFNIGVMQSCPVTHSTLMSLLEQTVTSASGDDEGTLTLTFGDGQVLRCFKRKRRMSSIHLRTERTNTLFENDANASITTCLMSIR